MDSPLLWFAGLIIIGLILLALSMPVAGKRNHQSRSGVLMHYHDSRDLAVPDEWNERQIEIQIGRLIERQHEAPNLLTFYLQTVRNRFIDRQAAKVKEQRTKYLETLIKTLATTKEAATLLYELRRLPNEQFILDQRVAAESKHVTEIAEMEQELRKEELRAKIAKAQKKRENFGGKQSREDRQMNEARQRHRRDIRFKVDISAGNRVDKLAALQQWRKETRRQILDDRSLSTDEREELLDELEKSYSEEKRKLDQNTDIFEED